MWRLDRPLQAEIGVCAGIGKRENQEIVLDFIKKHPAVFDVGRCVGLLSAYICSEQIAWRMISAVPVFAAVGSPDRLNATFGRVNATDSE